jgi:hypothetical protein
MGERRSRGEDATRDRSRDEALDRRALEIMERRRCNWAEAWTRALAEQRLVDRQGDLEERAPSRHRIGRAGRVTLSEQIGLAMPPHRGTVAPGRMTRSAALPAAVMRSAERAEIDPEAAELVARARRGGAPLDDVLRPQLEAALGARLDGVRVHTGADADAAARALGARAFAIGDDVFFRDGAYDPQRRDGQRLIAHEVAHTVQARGATTPTGGATTVSQPDDAPEREADAFADAFVHSVGIRRDDPAVSNATSGLRDRTLPAAQTGLSLVRVHTGDESVAAAAQFNVRAFAVGNGIHFGAGQYRPDDPFATHLIAHEVAHTVQQRGGAAGVQPQLEISLPTNALKQQEDAAASARLRGKPAVVNSVPAMIQRAPDPAADVHAVKSKDSAAATIARQPKKDDTAKDRFPWIGRIWNTSSAALRKNPKKDPADPHKGTLADLPEGDFVNVFGRSGGWLHVQATVDGKELEGWVSQELILFHSPTDWDDVRHMPSLREAIVTLKRAQTEKKQGVKIEKSRQESIDKAVEVVKRNPKYAVDESTYEVTSAKTDGAKVQVMSIEDFILFVEDVERKYPGAKAAQVATEVRQLWFSDSNWDVLVDGDGIVNGGSAVDIETEPNPIAKQYDMKDLAPSAGGKKINTRLGTVDIGHVMAGIDAALNGSPDAYPKERLKQRGADNRQSKFKYEKLKELNSSDPKSFTTWAGDLGQAYALYVADVVVDKKSGDLWQYVSRYAVPDEILGDIHGYIAVQVWKDTPAKDDPTGGTFKVSSVLRDLYLLDKPGGDKDDGSYRAKFEKVSGKAGTELKNFIWSETFSFAEPWYVKYVIDNSPAAALDGYDELVREFNIEAGQHEDRADKRNTLNGLVDDLLRKLDSTLDGSYTP